MLYVKPTDSHSHLDYDSCHSQHNKSSIPFSQFQRIRRNCTDWTKFVRHYVKLYAYFSLRGYPNNLVIPALHKVNKIPRIEALAQSRKENHKLENNSLYYINDYNPSNPAVRESIQEAWPILYRSLGT